MDKVKCFREYNEMNEKKKVNAVIKDNDFTLDNKVKGILFQQGAADMDGLLNLLKQNGSDHVTTKDVYTYINDMVKKFMSDEYLVALDNKVKDPEKILDICFNMVSNIHTNNILNDMIKLPF